jgi:type I site-specific restriction endonuclease
MDFMLCHEQIIPVAIIAAQDNKHSVMAGIQQRLGYAAILDFPTVFGSNGDAFYGHERIAGSGSEEHELPLYECPSRGNCGNAHARQVRKHDVFTQYGEQAPKVLEALLNNHADEGIENTQDIKAIKVNPFEQFGTLIEIICAFGGKPHCLCAVASLEQAIYQAA